MTIYHSFDEQLAKKALQILFIILITTGIAGNLANILVFAQKNMRKSLTNQLVLSLSLTDLAVLIFCSMESWFELALDYDIRIFSVYFCKFDTFVIAFLQQTRNVFTTSITIDRTILISTLKSTQDSNEAVTIHYQPDVDTIVARDLTEVVTLNGTTTGRRFALDSVLTTFKMTNKADDNGRVFIRSNSLMIKQFKTIIFLSICFMFLMNIHFLLVLDIHRDMNSTLAVIFDEFLEQKMNTINKFTALCMPSVSSAYFVYSTRVWLWLHMCVFFVVPVVIMSLAFILISVKIRKANAIYARFLTFVDYAQNSHIYLSKMNKNRRIVRITFLANVYFILSITPYFIYYGFIQAHFSQTFMLLELLVKILLYSNNALSLVFYGVSSQGFRRELALWRKKYNPWYHEESNIRM